MVTHINLNKFYIYIIVLMGDAQRLSTHAQMIPISLAVFLTLLKQSVTNISEINSFRIKKMKHIVLMQKRKMCYFHIQKDLKKWKRNKWQTGNSNQKTSSVIMYILYTLTPILKKKKKELSYA